MFPSPQEQAILKSMRKELQSGVTPHQFGLERLRIDELRDQAEAIEKSASRAELREQALKSHRFLAKTVSVWMERVREFLRSAAHAG